MVSPIVFIEKSRGKFKLIKYSLFQYLQQKGLCCIIINGISFLAIEFEDKFIIINQDELLTYVQKWINQDYINGVDYYTLDDIWNCVFDNFTSFFKSGVKSNY